MFTLTALGSRAFSAKVSAAGAGTAAKNILRRAEMPASVSGNESPILPVPPRRAPRSRKAGIKTARLMA
jgi:hypothetical protein